MGLEELQIFEELDIGSDSSVYPGHPITVAYLITRCFPNYKEAFRRDSSTGDYENALSNNKIPGAGGNVHAALDFLRYLRSEDLTWEAAVKWADGYWATCDGQATGGGSYAKDRADKNYYVERWRQGQEQADKIKPLLAERDFWWWDHGRAE